MGSAMIQVADRRFKIDRNSKYMALKAVKSLVGHSETIHDESGAHWVGVYPSDVVRASSLEDVLRLWHWNPTTDSGGDIIDLVFAGGVEGDEDILFSTLAPFIYTHSYIKVQVDRRLITWNFQSGRCSKVIL